MSHTDSTSQWRKSSRSGGGDNCVEVAPTAEGVYVRDSKDPDGPILHFQKDPWRIFLQSVRDGVFDA